MRLKSPNGQVLLFGRLRFRINRFDLGVQHFPGTFLRFSFRNTNPVCFTGQHSVMSRVHDQCLLHGEPSEGVKHVHQCQAHPTQYVMGVLSHQPLLTHEHLVHWRVYIYALSLCVYTSSGSEWQTILRGTQPHGGCIDLPSKRSPWSLPNQLFLVCHFIDLMILVLFTVCILDMHHILTCNLTSKKQLCDLKEHVALDWSSWSLKSVVIVFYKMHVGRKML